MKPQRHWEQRKIKENNMRCTNESETKKRTNDTQNANRKRQLKECSKPNLKSERKWGSDWNNDTMVHTTVKKKAKCQGLVKENEARGYHKSLILTRGIYYVDWEVPIDVVSSQILSNFSQNSLTCREPNWRSISIVILKISNFYFFSLVIRRLFVEPT